MKRAESMTQERRTQIAKKAAAKRGGLASTPKHSRFMLANYISKHKLRYAASMTGMIRYD
jgi:hypothetical protein